MEVGEVGGGEEIGGHFYCFVGLWCFFGMYHRILVVTWKAAALNVGGIHRFSFLSDFKSLCQMSIVKNPC